MASPEMPWRQDLRYDDPAHDHVGVVVDDLQAAISFFVELSMGLDGGTALVEGAWVDRVVGLDDVRVEIAFARTPDGHGGLELTKFHHPTATAEPDAAANTFGLRRLMFAVDDIDDVVARMRAHGAELVGEVAQFESRCSSARPGSSPSPSSPSFASAPRSPGGAHVR